MEGGAPELSKAIRERRWEKLTNLSDRQRALLSVSEKLSAKPTQVVQKDWEPLRKTGLDDKGCLEVAHIVGLFNYLTRLADGMGLELDEPMNNAANGTGSLSRPSTPTTEH